MLCELSRATGGCEDVNGLADLFNNRLQNDDVQDFDRRWDQALSAASEIPAEKVLEGFIQVKNYRIPFSFRLSWLCMNKRKIETTNNQAIADGRHQ